MVLPSNDILPFSASAIRVICRVSPSASVSLFRSASSAIIRTPPSSSAKASATATGRSLTGVTMTAASGAVGVCAVSYCVREAVGSGLGAVMGISDGGSVEGNRTIDGIGNSHDRQGVGAVDLRGLLWK